MQELLREIKETEKSIAKQSAQQYQSSFTAQIAEAEAQLNALRGEFNR